VRTAACLAPQIWHTGEQHGEALPRDQGSVRVDHVLDADCVERLEDMRPGQQPRQLLACMGQGPIPRYRYTPRCYVIRYRTEMY
jgi:hypothetical protein